MTLGPPQVYDHSTSMDESFFGDSALLDRFGKCASMDEIRRTLLLENRLPEHRYALVRDYNRAGWLLVRLGDIRKP